MKKGNSLFVPLVSALSFAVLIAVPLTASGGSDSAFNQMTGAMTGGDTGSQWFDYYVETVNQEIAYKAGGEAFGAAGPSGPATGFDAFLGSFLPPDTGSRWFNGYVDNVNYDLRTRAPQ